MRAPVYNGPCEVSVAAFCKNCERGFTGFCTTVNPGFAGGAYGYADMGPYNGGQAGLLRAPYVDFNCLRLPPDAREEEADYAMLSATFPTGYHGTEPCRRTCAARARASRPSAGRHTSRPGTRRQPPHPTTRCLCTATSPA